MRHDERFEVEYSYNQFNSWAADNGCYTRTVTLGTAEEARALAAEINAFALAEKEGRNLTGEEEERAGELKSDLIPWEGYFIGARAVRAVRSPLEGA